MLMRRAPVMHLLSSSHTSVSYVPQAQCAVKAHERSNQNHVREYVHVHGVSSQRGATLTGTRSCAPYAISMLPVVSHAAA